MSTIDPNSLASTPPVDPDARSSLNAPAFAEVWLSLALVTIAVATRLMGRWRALCLTRPHAVDIMTVLSYILYIGVIYCAYRIISYDKMFIHQWDFRIQDLTALLRVKFVSVNFYIPMLLLMKSAILFDWIRLLLPAGNRSTCFWACQTLAWIHILFYVAEMFAWNLACTPYARNWDSSVAGSCIDYKAIDMCSAVMNLAIDLVMLLLPLKWIRLRETEAQTRLGMLVIFGIGLFACIAAAFRLQAGVMYYISDDLNYHFSYIALWVVAETTCGFVLLSAPCVPGAASLISQSKLMSRIGGRVRTKPAILTSKLAKQRDGIGIGGDDGAAHKMSHWRDGGDDDVDDSDGVIKMDKRGSQIGSDGMIKMAKRSSQIGSELLPARASYKWLSDMKTAGGGSNGSSGSSSKALKSKSSSGNTHTRNSSALSLSALTEPARSNSTEELRSISPEGGSSSNNNNNINGDSGAVVTGGGGILRTTQIERKEHIVPIDERTEACAVGWKSPWERRVVCEDPEHELGVSVRVL